MHIFGENANTILGGLVALGMGAGVVYFAAVMIPAEAIDASVRGTMIMIGVGLMGGGASLMAARSNAASRQAVQRIRADIQHVEGEAVKRAEEVATEVVAKADAKPPA